MLVSTTSYAVSNGSITVSVPGMDASDAYQLLVTPTSGATTWQQTYEAENATVQGANRLSSANASNGGYVGQIDNNTDMRTDSFVDFLVNVPTTRAYTMTIRYANAHRSQLDAGAGVQRRCLVDGHLPADDQRLGQHVRLRRGLGEPQRRLQHDPARQGCPELRRRYGLRRARLDHAVLTTGPGPVRDARAPAPCPPGLAIR